MTIFTTLLILGSLLRGCGNIPSSSASSKLPPIPVEVSTRLSVSGGSFVLQVKNTSSVVLFDVVFEGKDSQINRFEVQTLDDFSPGQMKEIGWLELKSWNVQPGETFSISARGFQPATFKIPPDDATGS